ncbi:arginine deiminase-related protein [Dokdonella sp.]|uniref:arginine deiminase-related protein n=1 Tax=Dokdonella sp. TaxID=2291710 RepID=UPI001B226F1D|nr:arginine deiminase-related protein [Dokdonella sp.]MBO9661560.1 amidinotransferase [Dokdonella sp.]
MFVTDPRDFLAAFSRERLPVRHAASARAAFLVAPASDALAAESARDNRYMAAATALDLDRAASQHGELARRLGDDVPVLTFPGDPACPDGLFPNNVFATAHGRLIVGRMRHAVRRREAGRGDVRAFFRDVLGYRTIDLSQRQDLVAELTGALVIDRARGIGYCGLSERCDLAGARAMHEAFGLALTFCFELAAGEYHTNVVFALLAGRLPLLAADGFRDAAVPAAIAQVYGDAVWLDAAQKHAFAGNAIALAPRRAWMSACAAASLQPAQLAAIERHGFALGEAPLDEIEKAGGSLRCCVAEIF